MRKKKQQQSNKLICESSLQAYFFNQLQELNSSAVDPVSNESIFYSSNLLDTFSEPARLFEFVDGKLENKVLGIKMLEAESLSLSLSKRKEMLKDVGDSALVICGFFTESCNRKIFDVKYYRDLGKVAYQKLNMIIPELYHVPSFYKSLACSFDQITLLFSILSQLSLGQNSGDNLVCVFTQSRKLRVS